jgi:hypothetical protein
VVAANARAAESARAILEKHGIDIDNAVNGAVLKREVHQSTHTAQYYDDVNRTLDAADKLGGRDAVIDALCSICMNIGGR